MQVCIYTSSTSYHNPLTIDQLKSYSVDAITKYPPKEMMWCPDGECTKSDWYFRINVLFTHYLPAYLLDVVNQLTGKRAKMVVIGLIAVSVCDNVTLNNQLFCNEFRSNCTNEYSKRLQIWDFLIAINGNSLAKIL